MSATSDRLVWIDCEMTGLDTSTDELVEIAVIVTDFDLNILDPGLDIIIKPSDASLEAMGDFVREMHSSSGLLDELAAGVSVEEAERQVIEYVKRFAPGEQRPPLAGNSIGTDRMFIAKYMPNLDRALHYRNVDVSSVKELARRWYPRAYFNSPEKAGGHRALADILESVQELEYYRRAVFVAQPGPSSDECKANAAAVVNQSTSAM